MLQELAASWEAIVAALAAGDKPAVAEAALGYVYVWYNFMPLARGSAVVGYITLLGIFLAAGMPISAPIPKVRAWASVCCMEMQCGNMLNLVGARPCFQNNLC